MTSTASAQDPICLIDTTEPFQGFPDIIGKSPELQETLHLVTKVARTDSTVLVLGETGTGKELVARAIHDNSFRHAKAMVYVNCATLPANLIESELFGHERGSFTGATDRRIGRFELAHNSTLFLDEIGEMPMELQVKLLRALQEREIQRVGGGRTIKVDVRIIAATNRDLDREVDEGRFRADLYYRLNIFPICMPPLRRRMEDIPLLATHFMQKHANRIGRKMCTISNNALQQIMGYDWPGNIRELEHVIERSMLLADSDAIRHIYLPAPRQNGQQHRSANEFVVKTIEDNERDHILGMLKYCKGRIAGYKGAAENLGIPPSTLSSKLKRLGIKKEHFSVC